MLNDVDDFSLAIGREVVADVWNATGQTITNGQVVRRATGITSGYEHVELAQADTILNSSHCFPIQR